MTVTISELHWVIYSRCGGLLFSSPSPRPSRGHRVASDCQISVSDVFRPSSESMTNPGKPPHGPH